MELSFVQNLILGFISGFAEVLPVSAQAHRLIVLELLGVSGESAVLRFMLHLSTAGALYFYCKGHIVRMMRARRLVRVPKNRRKRPLDTEALTDFRLLTVALIPVIPGILLYSKAAFLAKNLAYLAALMLINGILLYIPQYLPGSNKLSGSLSPVDSLCFGLGGILGMFPGVSSIGGAVSMGSIRGMEQNTALSFALLLNIPIQIGFAVCDLIELVSAGAGSLAFGSLVYSVFAGAAAFVGIILAINVLKKIINASGFHLFAFYCWGAALLTFLIYLAAA